jgi:hypothetical protein
MHIGSMDISYVEDKDGEWLDEETDIKEFCKGLSVLEVTKGLGLSFDGILDYPEDFIELKFLSVGREVSVECNQMGIEVSNISFYLEVTSKVKLEEKLEDLFHIIVPIVEVNGATIAFTDFSDYEVYPTNEGEV